MPNLKSRILMTACVAAVGVTGLASSASAAPPSNVYGGGSSLVAPYWRQTGDCYGKDVDLIFAGTPPTFSDPADFNYTGSGPQNCATKHIVPTLTVNYISTGSGTGIAGLYSHDPKKYGEIDAGGDFYPSVQYGLSDAGLALADDQVWNNGGTEHGVTVVCPGCTPGQGQYGNPLQLYGPLVQFPFSVDPVTITYDPAYEKNFGGPTYHFNIKASFKRADGSGGLRLDATTYCKIFNGQITNWNDPTLQALNGNVPLRDPADTATFNVPLQIVGRSDSSGTTSIVYRHWATVCASLAGNQYLPAGGTTLPAGLFGVAYNKSNPNYPAPAGETLGKFTEAAGSDGVAQYVAFTAVPNGTNGNCTGNANCIIQGRMGYVGPDYVLPAVLNTQVNNYGLNTATLKNSLGQFEAPTASAAATAYKTVSPPQSDANGNYCQSCGTKLRANPQDWAEPIDNSSPLGNPNVSGSYAIVGSTNFLGYTCYATAASEKGINGAVGYVFTRNINIDAKNGILAKAGLAPLPSNWRKAVLGTFFNNSNNLGLNFGIAQSTAGACSVSGVVGG